MKWLKIFHIILCVLLLQLLVYKKGYCFSKSEYDDSAQRNSNSTSYPDTSSMDGQKAKPMAICVSCDNAIPSSTFSYEDALKNLELTLIIFGCLITLIVSISAIVIPIISIVRKRKAEEDIKERFISMENSIKDKFQAIDNELNRKYDISLFQTEISRALSDHKIQLEKDLETFKAIISDSISNEKIANLVCSTVNELFDSYYKDEIFRTTINYNKSVLGQTSNLKDLQLSILRRFSGQIAKVLKPMQPEKIKSALDNVMLDNYILGKVYCGDEEIRKEAIGLYIRSHPFEELVPVLDDFLKEYQTNPSMFNLIIEAKEAAKNFNDS